MNRRWHPDGTREVQRPEEGDLIAFDHAVWRVIEVRDRPDEDWTDEERQRVALYKPEHQHKFRPFTVTLRPAVITSDDPRARDHDKPIGPSRQATYGSWRFHVYTTEHYPICVRCGEPTPCRELVADRATDRALEHAARYEDPTTCPDCEKGFGPRQKTVRFEENIHVPLGPPVRFHRRGSCLDAAARYEQRWAQDDPSRTLTLSCPGTITEHDDATYTCNGGAMCPGAGVIHPARGVCCERSCCTWSTRSPYLRGPQSMTRREVSS